MHFIMQGSSVTVPKSAYRCIANQIVSICIRERKVIIQIILFLQISIFSKIIKKKYISIEHAAPMCSSFRAFYLPFDVLFNLQYNYSQLRYYNIIIYSVIFYLFGNHEKSFRLKLNSLNVRLIIKL